MHHYTDVAIYILNRGKKNPNDTRKLTGVSATTHFVQIALTPKHAGLVWTFFY